MSVDLTLARAAGPVRAAWTTVNDMASCAINGCGLNKRNKPNVSFFRFPANKKMCEKWTELCKNKDTINVDNARVCSLHFGSPDYKRHLKYELLDLPVPKRLRALKDDAVPTRRIPKLNGKIIISITT